MKKIKRDLELKRVYKSEKQDYRRRGYDILDSENWWSTVADRSFKTLKDAEDYTRDKL